MITRQQKNLILTVLIVLGLFSSATQAFFFKGDNVIEVRIQTVDTAGKPIPWVSIGAAYEGEDKSSYIQGFQSDRVRIEDAFRILNRYPDSWEYWHNFFHQAQVPYLEYAGTTDNNGRLIWTFRRDGWFKDNPGDIEFGFAGYRLGLNPAEVRGRVPKNGKQLEVTLVLEKNKDYKEELPAYLQRFYEIKADLSDSRRNSAVNMENYQRLEQYRKDLAEGARQAHEAGDSRSAGIQMLWLAIAPEIYTNQKGKPVGYSQGFDSYVAKDIAALEQAYRHDPDNVLLHSLWLLERPITPRKEDGRDLYYQARWAWLQEAEALAEKAGPILWPRFYDSIANTYGAVGSYEKSVEKMETSIEKMRWLQSYEPRWRNEEKVETSIRIRNEWMQEWQQ